MAQLIAIILIIAAMIIAGCRAASQLSYGTAAHPQMTLERFDQEVPGAAYSFTMIPIPGDPARGIKPFWISQTEITWEAFDQFVYGLDDANRNPPPGVDAISRPSKPYMSPDRGFGHDGFAAIGMSHHSAAEFCRWLSARSGRRYRLPTEAEWEHACAGGSEGLYASGNDVRWLDACAWFKANSGNRPHAVATKYPNSWGVYDMHGNVAEWCNDAQGNPIVKGGSYRDDADSLQVTARLKPDPAWNARDPQTPKSRWWLADAPFIGFRIVCEP